jgi:hypothetical protein
MLLSTYIIWSRYVCKTIFFFEKNLILFIILGLPVIIYYILYYMYMYTGCLKIASTKKY